MNYDAVERWMIALVVTGFSLVVLYCFQYFLKLRDEKGSNPLISVLKKTHLIFLFVISVYIGSRVLHLKPGAEIFTWRIFVAVIAIQAGLWGNQIIYQLLQKSRLFGIVDSQLVGSVSIIDFLFKAAMWSVIALFLLGNWGFDITALVAGLGIGGIAVALAVQNILGDLFASLSIVVDKPFTIGDYINIDEFKGHVEHIGLKTTRIRSLSGELLVFSNTDLLKSRIRNFEQMKRRRVVFDFSIDSETPAALMRTVPKLVENIIVKSKQAPFERCHFKEFGDYGYNFEVVYWIDSPDTKTYMDIQHEINLSIVEIFAAKGIAFAPSSYPYVVKSDPKSD